MADDENIDTPAPPQRSKIIPLVLAANTLLLAGVLIFVMRKPAPAAAVEHAPAGAEGHAAEGAGEGHAAAGPESGPGPILKLDSFIIQLKTGESEPRYVRVAFDLEVMTEADKTVISNRISPIRDSVISYFADRTLDELRGSDGMEQTKSAVLKRMDAIVPHRIKAVYITDFVVQ